MFAQGSYKVPGLAQRSHNGLTFPGWNQLDGQVGFFRWRNASRRLQTGAAPHSMDFLRIAEVCGMVPGWALGSCRRSTEESNLPRSGCTCEMREACLDCLCSSRDPLYLSSCFDSYRFPNSEFGTFILRDGERGAVPFENAARCQRQGSKRKVTCHSVLWINSWRTNAAPRAGRSHGNSVPSTLMLSDCFKKLSFSVGQVPCSSQTRSSFDFFSSADHL